MIRKEYQLRLRLGWEGLFAHGYFHGGERERKMQNNSCTALSAKQ